MHQYVNLCVLFMLLSPELSAQTQSFENYYNQGLEKLNNKDYKRAVVDFTIALEIEERIEGYISRAEAKEGLEDHEGALQDYDEAIRLNSGDAVLYNNRGNIYDNLLNFREAIQNYDKAISLDSTYANAYFNRGISFYNVHNYQNARKDFLQVIRLSPEDSEGWVGLGLSQYKLGDKEQACASFLKAQKLDVSIAREYLSKYCQ